MNYTEKEIIEKAKQILKDIEGQFYNESIIGTVTYNEKKRILDSENQTLETWTVSINSLLDNKDFLIISDETGEPIYYQNFNAKIFEVKKDENGIYELNS